MTQFDNTKVAVAAGTFGKLGAMIDYSAADVTLAASVKAVVVCGIGNVVYRAIGEATNAITITNAPPGMILPHLVGTIVKIGTTATLATIGD